MNLEKRYLDLARKITKDVETMSSHLDAIKVQGEREHLSSEEKEFYTQWYTWLVPSLDTLIQAKEKIVTHYQRNYPEGEAITTEPVPAPKKPKKSSSK